MNVPVSYSVTGKGPVLLWLHGFMEDKSIWKGQLAFFNTMATNICIDLLGHGKTGSLGNEHSMELQAQMIISVLNTLGIQKYSVIGHSMGGYVGLSLLKMGAENIEHLVLLNSTARSDTIEKNANRKRALKIVAKQKDMYARMGVINLFSRDSRELYADDILKLISIAQKTTVQGISAALVGMMHRSCSLEVFKKYEGGKLIISGKNDPVLMFQDSYKEAVLVGAKFEQLKGGHISYVESKNQLNEILSSFLGC